MESVELDGVWWRAGTLGEQVPGKVTFAPGGPPRLKLTGTFKTPSVHPVMGKAIARGAIAAALGVATAGIGALIPLLDVGKDVEIRAHDRRRVVLVRDLLAEDVDRRQLPFAVEAAHGLACVLELRPRDVALRELVDDRPRDRRQEAHDRAVEDHDPRIL